MNELRLICRQLWRNPAFTAGCVVTLAIGISVNTTLFSVVRHVLLRPLPYPEADRLVTLWEQSPRRGLEHEMVSPPNLEAWRAQARSIEQYGFWTGGDDFNLDGPAGMEKGSCNYVSSSLFPLLGVKPALGRGFLPVEDLREGPQVAMLSHDYWKKRFASDPAVLGKTITVDTYGRRAYQVVGVMPEDFHFPARTDVWLAAGWNGLPRDRRGGHWLKVVARLRPGATVEAAQTELSAIQSRLDRENPSHIIGSSVQVVPLLEHTVGRNVQRGLWLLWAFVGCVLLIACANAANLMLSRAVERQREIALRLALGASRRQILRQLLLESSVIALVAGAVGVLLSIWLVDLFARLGVGQIPRIASVRVDTTASLFNLAASLFTGVLFGLAPAWHCSGQQLNSSLKQTGLASTASRSRIRLRDGLVVGEIALSLALLVAAGLLTRAFARLASTDRGFQTENLITAKLDFSIAGFTTWVQPTDTRPQITLRAIIENVRHQPGVQSVAAISKLPEDRGSAFIQEFVLEPAPSAFEGAFTANFQGVTPDFFKTLGLELVRGRDFAESDELTKPGVVIVNESFVRRYFPNQDPVGRRLRIGGPPRPGSAPEPWSEIIGVARDVRKLNLEAEAVPDVYVSYWQWPMQTPALVCRTSASAGSIGVGIRSGVKAVAPRLPEPSITTINQLLSDTLALPRLQSLLAGSFGAVALAMAVIGLYSVISCMVAQQTREIGVRMALGAQALQVLAWVLAKGLRLVLLGLIAGVALGWAAGRLLTSQLHGLEATDPATFAGMASFLVLAAMIGCWFPARRAARVDPMVALRCE